MKVEFNGTGFSAEMNEGHQPAPGVSAEKMQALFKGMLGLILGVAALLIATGLLPFGLFMNVSSDILSYLLGSTLPHYMTVLCVFFGAMNLVSIACGVLSIVFFAKSKKRAQDSVGLALSIVSFVLSATTIVITVIGMTAW